MKRELTWVFWGFIGTGLLLVAVIVARSQNHMLDSDFFTFWLGAKLVGQCQNPYDPVLWKAGHLLAGSTWLENPIYCYPLPLAYLTAWIGIIPMQIAGPVWLFLSVGSILAGILVLQSTRAGGRQLRNVFPVLLGLALFRPVLTTIRNGQQGGFYLLALVLILYFAEKRKWVTAGLITALLLLKPTLGLPILGLLFIWLYKNRGGKAILVSMLAVCGALLFSVINQPGWPSAFLSVGLQKGSDVFMFTPTIWGIAGSICRMDFGCARTTGSIFFILLTIAGMFMFWKYSSRWNSWLAGSVAILVGLLITPYLWAYDQILLIIPILHITSLMAKLKVRYLYVSLVPLIFSFISLLLLFAAMYIGKDVGSILLTLIVGGILVWLEMYSRKKENGNSAD